MGIAKLLSVGVVGAGYWGRNLIRNFATSSDWVLGWVCDLDRRLAASRVEAMPSVEVTSEFEQVLSDPAVDAIAIATPVGTHHEVAMAALAAGKHVLVEKPLAATLVEGDELVAFAAECDLRLMTDHTFCYTAAVRYIADMIKSGELGTFHYLDSVRINLGLVQSDVDVFWDLAPHDLSILDFILSDDIKVVSVSATGADPLGIGKATLGYLSIGLSTGAIANVHVNWMSPVKVRHTIVAGSKKMVVWDDNNPSQRLSVYDAGITLENDAESRLRTLVGYRSGDMVAPALVDLEALSLVVGEFAASIREHRDPLTSGADGLAVLRILDAARRSLELGGGPVTIGAGT